MNEEKRYTGVIHIIAVDLNPARMDCCDEEEAHVWVTATHWSPRRAYYTGASPFVEASGLPAADLYDAMFYADLPTDPPPSDPEQTAGERLEWPNLRLAPPVDEVLARLGIEREQ